MQSVMNLKVKFRESFRPFAPAVLAERAAEFFELSVDSPYMLLVVFVLAWTSDAVKAVLNKATFVFGWPGLDKLVQRMEPVVAALSMPAPPAVPERRRRSGWAGSGAPRSSQQTESCRRRCREDRRWSRSRHRPW